MVWYVELRTYHGKIALVVLSLPIFQGMLGLALPSLLCYHLTELHLTFDMGFLVIILHVGKSGG